MKCMWFPKCKHDQCNHKNRDIVTLKALVESWDPRSPNTLLSSSSVRSVPGWPLSGHSRSRPCTGAWRVAGRARWRPHPSLPERWLHSPKEQRAEGGQEERSGQQAYTPQEHVVCRWKQLASEYTVNVSVLSLSTRHLCVRPDIPFKFK